MFSLFCSLSKDDLLGKGCRRIGRWVSACNRYIDCYKAAMLCKSVCVCVCVVHRVLFMVVPVYIAELSPKRIRGRLVSFTALALSGGTLVSGLYSYEY